MQLYGKVRLFRRTIEGNRLAPTGADTVGHHRRRLNTSPAEIGMFLPKSSDAAKPKACMTAAYVSTGGLIDASLLSACIPGVLLPSGFCRFGLLAGVSSTPSFSLS
jgi:hypothetical protein